MTITVGELGDRCDESQRDAYMYYKSYMYNEPLVIGAYGETDVDFQEVLKVCARMAVARGDVLYGIHVQLAQLGQGRAEIGQMQVVTSGRYRLQYPEF